MIESHSNKNGGNFSSSLREDIPAEYVVSNNGFKSEDGKQYRVVYSTKVSADARYEPFVSSVPLNTRLPCFGYNNERLVIEK